ncbi:hypothetical protein BH11PLA2_BH11PLA2_25290 [soil metagenome]
MARKTKPNRFSPTLLPLEDRWVPATLTVNTNLDGINHSDSLLTLREAIDAVNAGSSAGFSAGEIGQINTSPFTFGKLDAIRFDNALVGQTIALSGAEPVITKSVAITGTSLAGGITIGRANNGRHLNVNDNATNDLSVTLSQLTFTGGVVGASGGSIFSRENLTINGCTFTNNQATTGNGGAINAAEGSLTVNNSTFTGNKASVSGGAIALANITATYAINNCTFAFNIADSDNTGGSDKGGAIFLSNTATLNNCIIVGNIGTSTASDDLRLVSGAGFTGSNNLIGDAATAGGIVNGVNGNIVGVNGSGALAATSVISSTLASNGGPTKTLALVANSPAIDKGGTTTLTNDQRGAPFTRVAGSAVDIGAFESGSRTFTVSIAADEDDGNYAANDLSLREAVNATNANPGADTILFNSALSGQTLTLDTALADISSALTITGLGASSLTIARIATAATNFTIFRNSSGVDSSLSDMKLTNGKATGAAGGGAIRNAGTLAVNRVTMTGNSSLYGGGAYCGGNGATMTLTDCTISGNSASKFGGGVYNRIGSTTVTNCQITGNTSTLKGGGVYALNGILNINSSTINGNSSTGSGGGVGTQSGATITFTNTTISANTAKTNGGGIDNSGTLTVIGSTLSGNTSSGTAGALNTAGTTTITASTINGNSAPGNGNIINTGTLTIRNSTIVANTANSAAGVFNTSGTLTLTSVTIANNTAKSASATNAGVRVDGGTVTLNSTIVAENRNGNNEEVNIGNPVSGSFNLVGLGSFNGGLVNGVNGNIVGVNSGLLDFGNQGATTKTFSLFTNSAARNAGDPAITTADQRGFPVNGTRDIGAFEIQPIVLTPTTLASGTVGIAYSQQIQTTFPTLPADTQLNPVFSRTGSLPPGLTLALNTSTGIFTLTGTPTSPGTFPFNLSLISTTRDAQAIDLTITISATNTPPTITAIANQTTSGAAVGPLAFTIGDAQTAAASLTLTKVSTNTTLIPLNNIVFGGSGAARTVTVTTASWQFGTSTITVIVTDGNGAIANSTFTVAVTQSAPSILDSEFSVGCDAGGNGSVTLFNPNNTVRFSLTPFGANFTGGIRTASADFTGDGVADLAVASGPGIAGTVKVFDGVTQAQIALPESVAGGGTPFGSTFNRGIIVAAGDLNNDGKAELIITAEAGGGARVRIFQSSGTAFTQRSDFIALIGGDNKADTGFRGGSRAAVSDINGDGFGDLMWAAGAGGGPRIATFNGKLLDNGNNAAFKLTGDFFALSTTLRDGAFLAGGDVNGDGIGDLIAGGGSGAPPQIVGFSGATMIQNNFTKFLDFTFGNASTRQGVRVAVKDIDGDMKADLIAASAPTAGSHVAAFAGKNLSGSVTGSPIFEFDAFPGFSGGVFVG